MDSQTNNTSGFGIPPSGADIGGQLPTIHAPASFHAPENPMTQIGVPPAPVAPPMQAPPTPQPVAAVATPAIVPPSQPSVPSALQTPNEQPTGAALPPEDVDGAYDEEWVGKAREIVERTHADPYLQSKELSKLRALYVKGRYNKDIKVGE